MKYINGSDRKQITLLPDCIDDLVGQDNPVRVIDAFVKLCMKLGLYQKTLLAVDGSKFRAVNSKDNTFNVEILEKKLKRVDEHISEYLSQMDKEDETEPDSPTPEQIRGAILDLSERKEKYRKYLAELMENDETQILLTDPEAHRMHTSEHPFGTVKWYHGAHYLPCKGKDHN